MYSRKWQEEKWNENPKVKVRSDSEKSENPKLAKKLTKGAQNEFKRNVVLII